MALSFPPSPSLNDETTTGGRTYKWNGEAWELVGSGIAGPTGPTGGTFSIDSLSIQTGPTGTDYAAISDGSTQRRTTLQEVAQLFSDNAGVTGADRITNIVSLTQAEYDAITPDATTLYVVTD